MFCRKCGKAIAEDDLFCPYCGTEVKQLAAVAEPESDSTESRESVPDGLPAHQETAGARMLKKIAEVAVPLIIVLVVILFHYNRDEKIRQANEAISDFNQGLASQKAMDYDDAVRHYRKAAEQGVADAQLNLGACYYNGEGVTKDLVEAVKWYRKAAEQGDAKAQFNLGVCYANGQGVAEDKAEAVKWYRKAAEQGDADAIHLLRILGED